MKINILFFIIFISIGLILLILSLIFKNRDKKMFKRCSLTTKGKVIKYTLWSNNRVYFPIVEYTVNNVKYKQRLKYGWIINKSSSFNKVKTEIENNVKNDDLVIRSNAHISTNVLKEQFPIGTELDVFYNPHNPKKSYVMRFRKSQVPIVLFFTGLLFIVMAVIGYAFLQA